MVKYLHILAKASVSKCLDPSFASRITYQWVLSPSVGVTLPSTNLPALFIPKKQLIGGKRYTATVVVAMQQDASLSVTESVVIDTISSDLVAHVTGVQEIGSQEVLQLSAESSNDPDGNKDNKAKQYSWQVKDSNNAAVLINRKRWVPESTMMLSQNASALTAGNFDTSHYEFLILHLRQLTNPPYQSINQSICRKISNVQIDITKNNETNNEPTIPPY